MLTEVYMPKLGQTMEEGRIVRWVRSVGDQVAAGEVVLEIESDKSVFEVEAEGGGVLRKIFIGEDQTVPVATTLAFIADPDDEIPDEPLTPVCQQGGGTTMPPVDKDRAELSTDQRIRATPVAKRLAREKGVDLSKVEPADPGGTISLRDVENYLSARSAPSGAERRGDFLEIQGVYEIAAEEDLSSLRKRMAQRLRTSVESALHVSSVIEIDAASMKEYLTHQSTAAEAKITYTDILVKSAAMVLKDLRQLNATCDGQTVRYLRNINIGVAVAVPNGILVPVIRDADSKTISEISRELRTLADRARSGKLAPEEYSYGTFTLSNLGMFEVESFTSIINPPEIAILGIGAILDRPRIVDGQIAIRPVFKATLNIDHRVADGVLAARFLSSLKAFCEKFDG